MHELIYFGKDVTLGGPLSLAWAKTNWSWSWRPNLFSIGAKSKTMQPFSIVSFSGQEMFSEINFSLFLPLQNSNVVYLETFCANSVSGDGGTLHRAAFSQNKENLCLFTLCLLPPLQTQYCELEVRLLNIGILEVSRLLVDFFLRPLRPCDPGVAKK